MDNGAALRPDISMPFSSPSNPAEVKEEVKVADPEDQALAFIGASDGWKKLSDYIDTLETELEDLLRAAMSAQGTTFSEIGQRATVKEAVVTYLEKVRSRVTDAMEAVEDAKG